MDAGATHSAISISPTIIELPHSGTLIHNLFTRALLLLSDHAPPPLPQHK
jgi:hypothetical protein